MGKLEKNHARNKGNQDTFQQDPQKGSCIFIVVQRMKRSLLAVKTKHSAFYLVAISMINIEYYLD
jgi:hypothetical protein